MTRVSKGKQHHMLLCCVTHLGAIWSWSWSLSFVIFLILFPLQECNLINNRNLELSSNLVHQLYVLFNSLNINLLMQNASDLPL